VLGADETESQKQLERLAFNGIANLPYSPLTYAMEDDLITGLPWWETGEPVGQHMAFSPPGGPSNTGGFDWPPGMEDDESGQFGVVSFYQPAWLFPEHHMNGQ